MPKISVTRRFQFCAGHRVLGHKGKCCNVHGHNYLALITIEGPLDYDSGMVIDFGDIKKVIGDWIDEKLDHGFILYRKDLELLSFFTNSKHKHLILGANPTAENLAHFIRLACADLLPDYLKATKVELWETENCYATSYA